MMKWAEERHQIVRTYSILFNGRPHNGKSLTVGTFDKDRSNDACLEWKRLGEESELKVLLSLTEARNKKRVTLTEVHRRKSLTACPQFNIHLQHLPEGPNVAVGYAFFLGDSEEPCNSSSKTWESVNTVFRLPNKDGSRSGTMYILSRLW